ncbi:Acyl-CoA dehydrogenase [Rhizobium sp. NFR07]|uniref:acyl-CoA dehydrogenase family protein n=1 Tax=Rhizobium sp. NFR07 TaxID=1566262 RepID=UPI0008E45D1C|nr:acyl-CoA dehydrogenase family protein [Rhizobium sp. NFR07]SFB65130.1 Acyl-CoA dehydrogenase [Rhizobium sp. NFR07]
MSTSQYGEGYQPNHWAQKAANLKPAILKRSHDTDQLRRLPDATLSDLNTTGLLSALTPKKFGGGELPLSKFFDVVLELGKADGSVAWTYAVLSCGSWMVATFFEETVTRDVLSSSNPLTAAVMSPTAIKARRVDGGMLIEEGTWTFNSGIQHAGWDIIGIPLFDQDGARVDLLFAIVPVSQLILIDDWHSMGLRGSGSSSVRTENLFVPDVRLASQNSLLVEKYPQHDGTRAPLYRLPALPTIVISMASPLIGIANGALEDFFVAATKRQTTKSAHQNQHKPATANQAVEDAAAKINAAEIITRRSIATLEALADTDAHATVEQKARMWRDACFASRLTWEAIDLLANATGGNFVREENPLSRRWRDVRTGVSHAGLNPATAYESFGRILFDLPSNTPLLPS